MRPLIIDLETIPIEDVESYLPDFSHRKGTKDEEKQAAQIADKKAAALRDAALDPDLSRIVCLGVGDLDMDTVTICQDESVEAQSLDALWSHVRELQAEGEDWCVVGYNILSFDLPRLYRRSLYLGVDVYQIQRDKYRHPRVIDLWDILSEQGRFPWRPIEYYVKRMNLDVPTDPHKGEDIPQLVQKRDWAAVRHHNACDLAKDRALAERLGVIKSVSKAVA